MRKKRPLQLTESNIIQDASEAMNQGRFGLAISIYTQLVDSSTDARFYLTRGLALLMKNDALLAEQDFREYRRRMEGPAQTLNLYVVVSLWTQGLRAAACEDWHQEMIRAQIGKITFGAFMGIESVLLLWWASYHEGFYVWRMPVEKRLKAIKKSKAFMHSVEFKNHWPTPVALYIFDEMSSDDALAFLDSNSSLERQKNRSHLYFSTRFYSNHDSVNLLKQLHLVSEPQGNYWQPEYHLEPVFIKRGRSA